MRAVSMPVDRNLSWTNAGGVALELLMGTLLWASA